MPLQADHILQPVSGQRPRHLVILLHGVGASGADLFSLAEGWKHLLPDAAFIAPNAPDRFDEPGYPDAWQWFSLKDITVENREARVQQVAPLLNEFLDAQLAAHGLQDRDLLLTGFSQGTIMALYVALRRPRACGGILGYSGRLAGPESLEPVGSKPRTLKPRTLLIHGTEDYVIPIGELAAAKEALQAHDVPVAALAMPGLSHRISPQGEEIGGRFLQYCIATPPEQGLQTFTETVLTPQSS